MKKHKKVVMIIFLVFIIAGNSLYAHQGRTDSNGGHKDNKNVSGLGSYHYHCGGHPAHLHTNGVCPYTSNVSAPAKETQKSTPVPKSTQTQQNTTNTTPVETKPKIVEATSIKIEGSGRTIKVGENILLSASIIPSDTNDKKIIWKSSDESIATVDESGKVIAKKSGFVNIIANTSNGKTDTIKIEVEKEKDEKDDAVNVVTTSSSNDSSNSQNKPKEENNSVGGIIGAIIVGLGGILGFNKLKK